MSARPARFLGIFCTVWNEVWNMARRAIAMTSASEATFASEVTYSAYTMPNYNGRGVFVGKELHLSARPRAIAPADFDICFCRQPARKRPRARSR